MPPVAAADGESVGWITPVRDCLIPRAIPRLAAYTEVVYDRHLHRLGTIIKELDLGRGLSLFPCALR